MPGPYRKTRRSVSGSKRMSLQKTDPPPPPDPAMIARQTTRWNTATSQYDIISRIAREISTPDLFNVARTTRSAWRNVWLDRATWDVLNPSTHCDGGGVRERRALLQCCPPAHIPCAAAHITCSLIQKSCEGCDTMVCDECRTHLLYQTLFESWGKSTNLWYPRCFPKILQEPAPFSDLPFPPPKLKPISRDHEVAPFPPNFTGNIEAKHCNGVHGNEARCESKVNRSAHDCDPVYAYPDGFWVTDAEGAIFDAAEEDSIFCAIHRQLGRAPMLPTDNGAFAPVIEYRIIYLCSTCSEESWESRYPGEPIEACECTLMQRFVDSWLCRGCARDAVEHDEGRYRVFNDVRYAEEMGMVLPKNCYCGKAFKKKELYVKTCAWCAGSIGEDPEGY